MARITVLDYDGIHFVPWFNNEIRGSRDLRRLRDSLTGLYPDASLTWSRDKILFTQDDLFFAWRGNIKYKRGSVISGGYINEFERNVGGVHGHIKVDSFRYNPKKESGTFWALTLPEEITSVIESDAKADLTPGEVLTDPVRGFTYIFETPYG